MSHLSSDSLSFYIPLDSTSTYLSTLILYSYWLSFYLLPALFISLYIPLYFLCTSLLTPHIKIDSFPPTSLFAHFILMLTAGTDCDGSYTSAMAASVTLYCSLIITIPGLLVIAFYGSFADRYGLKKTLMMPVLGNFMFCGCILLSLSGVMSPFYLHILLFGALCSGLSGNHDLFILSHWSVV